MTKRNDLSKKAGHIKPPLDLEEVKALVAGASARPAGKGWSGKVLGLVFILCSGAVVAGFLLLSPQGKQDKGSSTALPSGQNPRTTNERKETASVSSDTTKPTLSLKGKEPAASGGEKPYGQFALGEGTYARGLISVSPAKEALAQEPLIKPETATYSLATEGIQKKEPATFGELIQAKADSVLPLPAQWDGDSLTSGALPVVRDARINLDSNESKTRNKVFEPLEWPRNFARIDLYGLFSGVVTTRLIKNWDGIDFSSATGGRLSLGYERKFHKRLSLDLVASYGFSEAMIFTGASGVRNAECFINYKGAMFHLGARFYPIARPNGSGLFIGPYASAGFLKERYILVEENGGGGKLSMMGVNKGRSVALGGYIGGRLVIRRVFLEASTGFAFRGRDFAYWTHIIEGQDRYDQWRYESLHRLIEFSIGYSF